MKRLIIVLFLVFSGSAYAATDYQCVIDCQAKGYMIQFCQNKCSYQEHQQQKKTIKKTDFQCMIDCQEQGYKRAYCQEQCSY